MAGFTKAAGSPPRGAPPPTWARWAAAFKTSPDLVFALDADGHVLFSNHPLDLPGFAEPSLSIVRSACLRVFDTGHAESFETGEEGPGGTVAWYRCTASPILEKGAVEAALVVCIDITPRKRLEERLRRSEALMVDTQGTAHLGTWEWDVSQPHATWSEELYRIYGLTPENYVPSYEQYLEKVHPEDRQRVIDATNRVFHEHIPYSHDERIFRPDGSMRYLHTWAHPVLDANGKLVRLVGVCQDVTERKLAELGLRASEERWRAVFEHAALGIATLDASGAIVASNAALQRMLGLDAEALAAFALSDLAHLEDATEMQSALEDVLAGRSPRLQWDARLLTAAGEVVWTRVSASLMPGEETSAPFAIVVVEDVTARRHAEETDRLAAVRLAKIQELEEASAWKSEILNIASHELKNPLTPMNIQLYLLKDGRIGPLNERQARAVDTLSREAQRLGVLVRDLVDMARVQADRLSVRSIPLDLGPLVESVHAAYLDAVKEREVELVVEVDALPQASGDPDRLRQVLDNLVTNAMRFTPAGGTIAIKAKAVDAGVRVEVADTGPGLSAEQQARLFQPFSQVHDPATGPKGGTGLGLYICKGIVEAHGGAIGVDSVPGHGATFWFTLPRA